MLPGIPDTIVLPEILFVPRRPKYRFSKASFSHYPCLWRAALPAHDAGVSTDATRDINVHIRPSTLQEYAEVVAPGAGWYSESTSKLC